MKVFSYKEFKNVPIREIHDKYGQPGINVEMVRQRVLRNTMNMKNALHTPILKSDVSLKWPQRKINKLFDKVKNLPKTAVSIDTFTRKIRAGIAPELAIIKGKKEQTEFIELNNPKTKPKYVKIPKGSKIKPSKKSLDKKIAASVKKLKQTTAFEIKKAKATNYSKTQIISSKEDTFCRKCFKITSVSFTRKIYDYS